jgi:hypothetical protein
MGAVLSHGEITLLKSTKLGLQVDSTLEFVVTEEAFGGGARLVDDVEDRLAECGVDPIGDAEIGLAPVDVALRHGWRRGDMRLETELAEDRVEEAVPLAVVGVGEIEKDGDVRVDVHLLHNSGGSRLESDSAGVRCRRGSSRVRRGGVHGSIRGESSGRSSGICESRGN